MVRVTDLSVHINLEQIDEKDIYVKLDLILQFLFKNDLKGTVVVNRHNVEFDSGEE